MQIVIDIPEKVVTAIQNGEDYRYDVHTAIAQGTPYPQSGDSISRDYVEKIIMSEFVNLQNGTQGWRNYVNDTCESILNKVHSAPTVEEIEKPYIDKCRNAAIENNLPLYFIYYEETGIFEVYVTGTKELFEKRHCAKRLPHYEFMQIVNDYLDWYFDWKDDSCRYERLRGEEE